MSNRRDPRTIRPRVLMPPSPPPAHIDGKGVEALIPPALGAEEAASQRAAEEREKTRARTMEIELVLRGRAPFDTVVSDEEIAVTARAIRELLAAARSDALLGAFERLLSRHDATEHALAASRQVSDRLVPFFDLLERAAIADHWTIGGVERMARDAKRAAKMPSAKAKK